MKKILVTTFLILALGSALHAGEVKVEPFEWKAGEVEMDSNHYKKVKITVPENVGEITKIRPSCECLSGEIIDKDLKDGGLINVKLHVDHTLNIRFKIFLYVHINNDKKPAFRFNVLGKIKGKGLNLTNSQIVVFRNRVAKNYETIKEKLELLRTARPDLTFKEHLAKDLNSYRLFAKFEKEYMVHTHANIEMFMGDYYFIGHNEVSQKLDSLLVEKKMAQDKGGVNILYFYSVGCGGCLQIEGSLFPKLYKKYGDKITIKKFDIGDMKNYDYLITLEEKYNIDSNEPISVFVGKEFLGGSDDVIEKLPGVVEKALKNPDAYKVDIEKPIEVSAKTGVSDKIKDRFKSFNLITLIGAGLLDGVNPCAFATIIFLISFLAFAGRNRGDILIVGIFYTLTVFVTYLLLGIGIFKAIQSLAAYKTIAQIMIYLTVALVFGLAAFSLYDLIAYLVTKKTSGIILQLPLSLKQKIHSVIRTNIKAGGLIVGSIIIGFLVTLFEAVCTGQVYLPTIVFVLKDPQLKMNAIFYLVVYNLMFIVPLLVVFVLAYFGIGSKALGDFAQRNLVLTKLLMTVLFIGLGVLLLMA